MIKISEIAIQYRERTENNEQIINLYRNLDQWSNKQIGNSIYKNYYLFGFLYKRSQKKVLLSYTFHRRHITMDFHRAIMVIKHDKNDKITNENTKNIPFS